MCEFCGDVPTCCVCGRGYELTPEYAAELEAFFEPMRGCELTAEYADADKPIVLES